MHRDSGFGKFVSLTFGSDEVNPYSAEYSWNSNQIAHIMMGFCLASCWFVAAMSWRRLAKTGVLDAQSDPTWRHWLLAFAKCVTRLKLDYSVIILFMLIPIKELLDMWLDQASFGAGVVDPNWERLRFDALTDIAHWWTGMFLAALIVGTVTGLFKGLAYCYRPLIAAGGLVACLAFLLGWARPIWQEQKRVFDRSELPGNYTRLVVLANGQKGGIAFTPASANQWPEMEAFRAAVVNAPVRPAPRHFVIVGGSPEERTRLAVAMGCEHAFKIRRVNKQIEHDEPHRIRYVTATSLLERHQLVDQMLSHPYLECVVVDDFDVSTPLPTFYSPKEYWAKLRQRLTTHPERKPVMSKRVLSQFGLAAGPQVQVDPKSGLVELNRADIDALERQYDNWTPDYWDVHAPDPILARRQEVLIDVGKLAKKNDISTIWVLAGRTEGMSPDLLEKWVERRQAWLKEIAYILDVELSELRLIELAAPSP